MCKRLFLLISIIFIRTYFYLFDLYDPSYFDIFLFYTNLEVLKDKKVYFKKCRKYFFLVKKFQIVKKNS